MQRIDEAIINLLGQSEVFWVQKISERTGYDATYVCHRLRHLCNEGLVQKEKGDGEEHYRNKSIYSLTGEGKKEVSL